MVTAMLVSLSRFLSGSRRYKTAPDCSVRAVDILMRSGANYRDVRMCGAAATFTLSLRDSAAVERIFEKEEINFTRVSEHGFPRIIRKYKRRIGIPIGMLLFIFVLIVSGKIIWRIDVVGCDKVSEELVVKRLDELGFGIGTYVPSVDFDELHASYLLMYDDTAWISVNVRGTHAVAEIRETELPEKTVDEKHPHNLVAAEDAVIYSIEIHRGTPMVKVGDLVKKGELLASGMVDIKSGYLLFHARGEVMGMVERNLHIEVPLEDSHQSPTGNVLRKKRLKLFGLDVTLSDETEHMNKDGVTYDKSERNSMLSLFNIIQLPIEISETVYTEYAQAPISYTEKEARGEAYLRLSAELAALTKEGEIIARETEAALVNGVFTIDCKVTLICDISAEQPIYTDKTQEK